MEPGFRVGSPSHPDGRLGIRDAGDPFAACVVVSPPRAHCERSYVETAEPRFSHDPNLLTGKDGWLRGLDAGDL